MLLTTIQMFKLTKDVKKKFWMNSLKHWTCGGFKLQGKQKINQLNVQNFWIIRLNQLLALTMTYTSKNALKQFGHWMNLQTPKIVLQAHL